MIKPLAKLFVCGFFIPILLKGGEKNKRELNFRYTDNNEDF